MDRLREKRFKKMYGTVVNKQGCYAMTGTIITTAKFGNVFISCDRLGTLSALTKRVSRTFNPNEELFENVVVFKEESVIFDEGKKPLDAVNWQTMDTAPKTGVEINIIVKRRAGMPHRIVVGHYMPGGHCIEDHPHIDEGWYFWNGRMFDRAAEPLLWCHLPNIDFSTEKLLDKLDCNNT